MADKIVLQIEARMLDEATKVLKAIGVEAEITGKKGSRGFSLWSDETKKSIVALNQGLELMGRIRRGIAATTSALLEPIRLAGIQEQQEVRLAAVLRATEHAAGLSAKQLTAMANEVQALTAVDNDLVVEAEAVLLTFKQIGGEVFPRTLRAAIDMNALLGTDLKASVIQLGKALNDPILGVTALNRVGVTFTNTQRELIKELVRSGRLLEAQDIILKEVESQMGGVSELMGGTFLATVQNVGNAWSDLLKAVGAFVVDSPVVKGALRIIIDLFGKWEAQLRSTEGPMTDFRDDFDAFVRRAIPSSVRGLSALVGAFFDLSIGVVRLGSHIKELREDFGSFLPNAAAGFVTLEKNLGIISEGEWQVRMKEIGEFFDYWGPAAAESTAKIIKGLEGSKKASQDLLETAAKGLETITGEGSMLDQMIAEEETKEALDRTKAMLRAWARDVADFGFEGLRPWSVDPAETARAVRQLTEFNNRLGEIRKTDIDRQEDEIRDFYLGEIAAQQEALTRQLINQDQFAKLRTAIEARMEAEVAALRKSGQDELAKLDAQAIAYAEKQAASVREMLAGSLQVQRELRQNALENATDAERRRFEEQKGIWLREASDAQEHAVILEVLTLEHQARMRAILEEHGDRMRDEAKKEQEDAEALRSRERERARDQMEFVRDLELQAQVFRTQGHARRLEELERSFEIERASVLRRAELLEVDATAVQQFLEALQVEHDRAVQEITGTTSEGIQRAIEDLRAARETEFEAARDATLDIVRTGETALTDFILSIGDSATTVEEKIRKLVATVLQAMARIAAERAASQIFGALGFATGGIMPGQRVEMRSFANGGVARRPTMALFAEVPGKAEAFVPLPDGQRIPVKLDVSGLAAEQRGRRGDGGPSELNINFTIQALDAAGVDRILEQRRPQIQGMIVDGMRTSLGMRSAVREAANTF